MYTDFFGLQKLPFNLTPDPAFLYLPPKHRQALAGLIGQAVRAEAHDDGPDG